MVQNNQVLSLAWQNGHVALNEDSIICFVYNTEKKKKKILLNIFSELVLANTIFTIFVDKKCEQTPKPKY